MLSCGACLGEGEDTFFETIAWGPFGVRRSKKTVSELL